MREIIEALIRMKEARKKCASKWCLNIRMSTHEVDLLQAEIDSLKETLYMMDEEGR